TDNFAAMEKLVRHLAAAHCRSIGLVGIDEVDATSLKERRRGFYETVKALGLSVCEECRLPVYAENATDSGLKPEVMKHLTTYFTRNGEKLDAVICSEYGVVRETVHVLEKLGIRLHQDIQLCCIDEDYLAPGGFSFTHMKQDEEKIGEHAFALLQKKMEREPLQGEDYLIPAIFRERQPL
ncbi:MAG: substrate-binding domain-containing protein, partial [Oscillospiraceae bacterium]